jgi:hypothetical protein
MCAGKIRHETSARAARQAHYIGRGNAPYRCRYCGGWHVGTNRAPKLSKGEKARLRAKSLAFHAQTQG